MDATGEEVQAHALYVAAGATRTTPGCRSAAQDCPGRDDRCSNATSERMYICLDREVAMDRYGDGATMNPGNARRQSRDLPDPDGRITAAERARLEAVPARDVQ